MSSVGSNPREGSFLEFQNYIDHILEAERMQISIIKTFKNNQGCRYRVYVFDVTFT